MNNLLGKGISGIYYYSFSQGYYFSAGYFAWEKEYISFLNELKCFRGPYRKLIHI